VTARPGGVRRRAAILSLLVLSAACATTLDDRTADGCAMSAEDAAWREGAFAAWDLTLERVIGAEADGPSPVYVFYDARCVFTGADGRWRAEAHRGEATLPDGGSIPPQVASFAAPFGPDRRVYLAMALPSVWRADGVESALGLESLMTAVFVHEMTHTLQFGAYDPIIDEMSARWGLGEDFTDDAFQDRFRGSPQIAAAIQAESTLLFAAAFTDDDAEARDLARQALASMQARRARLDGGPEAGYLEVEDVFLSLEGSAQWAAFRWLTMSEGGGHDARHALPLFRRGGRLWSQDEGLALYLAVDRLLPGWTESAFATTEPRSALRLLADAVEGG
jgi:hypothetical protein